MLTIGGLLYRLGIDTSRQREVERVRKHIAAHSVIDKEFKRRLSRDNRLMLQERVFQQSKITMNQIEKRGLVKRLGHEKAEFH